MSAELIMLGTGSAFPARSYNTCFVIKTDGFVWMVDAGGGNGILGRLRDADFQVADIRHLFVTHTHTDHILGVVWIIRSVINLARWSGYEGRMNIYGNSDVIDAIDAICRLTLLESHYRMIGDLIDFHNTDEASEITLPGARVGFFDCRSEGVRQTGFRMTLESGTAITCLGDESLTERNMAEAEGTDWLMCGAFCSYADREIFKPYEKHHLTVRDVAAVAAAGSIANMLLYHCEDHNIEDREERYRDEAKIYYGGAVFVPRDGDRIVIE